jgi:hypothetical protein
VVLLLLFILTILFSAVWDFGFAQGQNAQELNFVVLADRQFFEFIVDLLKVFVFDLCCCLEEFVQECEVLLLFALFVGNH